MREDENPISTFWIRCLILFDGNSARLYLQMFPFLSLWSNISTPFLHPVPTQCPIISTHVLLPVSTQCHTVSTTHVLIPVSTQCHTISTHVLFPVPTQCPTISTHVLLSVLTRCRTIFTHVPLFLSSGRQSTPPSTQCLTMCIHKFPFSVNRLSEYITVNTVPHCMYILVPLFCLQIVRVHFCQHSASLFVCTSSPFLSTDCQSTSLSTLPHYMYTQVPPFCLQLVRVHLCLHSAWMIITICIHMFPFPVYRSSEYISIYTVPYYVYTCWEFLQQSTDKYVVYQATSKYIRRISTSMARSAV